MTDPTPRAREEAVDGAYEAFRERVQWFYRNAPECQEARKHSFSRQADVAFTLALNERLAALRAAPAEGVDYVPQRESWDCGVASLAMAAGVSYEAALAVVPESQRGDLLNTVHVTQWLGALGCAVRKTYAERDDLAGIRLLAHRGHFVVMRPDGRVNDPARGEGLPPEFYDNPFDVWEVHRLRAPTSPRAGAAGEVTEAMVEAALAFGGNGLPRDPGATDADNIEANREFCRGLLTAALRAARGGGAG